MMICLSADFTKFLKTNTAMPTTLTPDFLQLLIVQHEDSFVAWLTRWGRGVWTSTCESSVADALRVSEYSHLKFNDIKLALKQVAENPNGLSRVQKDFDAYAFCHKWGLLHTDQPIVGQETIFTFASPLHRRVAYRRCRGGREADAAVGKATLQNISASAIARFSPAAFQSRRHSQSQRSWGIPEAAFQDELYCCLKIELHNLCILTEYSHTNDGRIDFYVADHKWGIEVLQCGNDADLAEHAARFGPGGKYAGWRILDDYIILNFCSRSAFQSVKIEGKLLPCERS